MTVEVQREGQAARKVLLRPAPGSRSKNLFEGAMPPLAKGQYQVRLLPPPALKGDLPTTDFQIDPPAGELVRVEMDREDLAAAAKQSGGQFFRWDEATKLVEPTESARLVGSPVNPGQSPGLAGGSPATASGGGEEKTLLELLPPPQKVPLDTDPPIALWNTWPVYGLFLALIVAGVGSPETQADGIIEIVPVSRVLTGRVRHASPSIVLHFGGVIPTPHISLAWKRAGGETMRGPLEKRIAALRGQVRRLLALHGSSWVVAGTVLAILAAGLADWLFHLTREVRLGLLLAAIGLTGWLLARFVVAPLVIRFRDLDIALRIEDRWPGLQDRLATTVQFLAMKARPEVREDVHGSTQLREETIRRTLAEVESIDFREVVEPRPARQALATAAVPVALGLALLVAAPDTCRLALERLIAPFGSAQWPKQTHLVILDPNRDGQKVARGESFRLEVGVAEGEALPASGDVTYVFDNGETVTRRLGTLLARQKSRDDQPRFVDRIAKVTRSFRYRVAAGDDITGWRSVVAVPPPSLTFARIKLSPPEYTREPRSTVEPGGGKDLPGSEFDIEHIVVGTKVELEARANKPLAEAAFNLLGSAPWVRPEDSEPKADGTAPAATPATPAVTLRDGGKRIVAAFTVEAPGSFGFDLRDTEGFRGQQRHLVRFNIHAIPDNVPQVVVEEPPGNRDVTANAVVPIVIDAQDDFGLGKVWVEYSVAYGGSEPVKHDPLVLWVVDGLARQQADPQAPGPVRLEPRRARPQARP